MDKYDLLLRCDTCGSNSDFEYNEDKSYIKCVNCGREYYGGIEELKEYNFEFLEEIKSMIKDDIINSIKNINK